MTKIYRRYLEPGELELVDLHQQNLRKSVERAKIARAAIRKLAARARKRKERDNNASANG